MVTVKVRGSDTDSCGNCIKINIRARARVRAVVKFMAKAWSRA